MPPEVDLREFHNSNLARFKALAAEVEFSLRAGCEERSLKVHTISSRVKEIGTFLEKVQRKAYSDPIVQCVDLIGARVVCRFLDDLAVLDEVVSAQFDLLERQDKTTEMPIDSFGYSSIHYVCRIRDDHAGPRYEPLRGLQFEVQCRTMLMDAWANVSHYLIYKGEASIPSGLRRDFHALSGLFYVADKQFQVFAENAARNTEETKRQAARNRLPADTEINLDTMVSLLHELFPDRASDDLRSVSEVSEELSRIGYTTAGQIRRSVDRARVAASRYEASFPPTFDEEYDFEATIFTAVGMLRTVLALLHHEYRCSRYPQNEQFEKFLPLVDPDLPQPSGG